MIKGLLPEEPQPRLSFQQIQAWNKFMQNAPKGTRQERYTQYVRATGDKSLPYPALDNELNMVQQNSADLARRKNVVFANDIHTGDRFPEMVYDDKSVGGVNGNLAGQGTPNPSQEQFKGVPQGAEILYNNGHPYYLDGNGDIVHVPDWVGYKPPSLMPNVLAKK